MHSYMEQSGVEDRKLGRIKAKMEENSANEYLINGPSQSSLS